MQVIKYYSSFSRFLLLRQDYCYFTFQIANNKCADQTARMHRLVCAFVVRKQQSQGFLRQGPYGVEVKASWPPPGYAPEIIRLICAFVVRKQQSQGLSRRGSYDI